MGIDKHFFPEVEAGGFTRYDGTIQFYLRVNSLLHSSMTVVDLGAGRGKMADAPMGFRRNLLTLKGKVHEIVGIDVDPIVAKNPLVDRALIYDGKHIPLEDSSVDLLLSDHTFEHISDPEGFVSEIYRVLKPGGWVCARTPYFLSALVLASAMIPSFAHAKALKVIQPGREAPDVFPTFYKLNSFRSLRRYFPTATWDDASYTWMPEPSYHFNSSFVYSLFLMYSAIKRPIFGGDVLLVFKRKRK